MCSVFRLISLHVHSSLDAVGLTAAFSPALGNAGISANVDAAFHIIIYFGCLSLSLPINSLILR
jgi:hypothetical protein